MNRQAVIDSIAAAEQLSTNTAMIAVALRRVRDGKSPMATEGVDIAKRYRRLCEGVSELGKHLIDI